MTRPFSAQRLALLVDVQNIYYPAKSLGDKVDFYGEFESNSQGGVIHWTHHDPNGQHVGGWLKHKGRTYQ